ncbi:unnamed protein product [Paramecium primaurelia]|uniref:Uncharacterized protein n=1 Tax=Paramecium primaurelia TaxID=5886 RepID=A0A8S1NMU9_PARPR|nr:unnamed protein product [Paramecium primaurelia]
MEIKDFQRYFQAIFVGYNREEYLYNSITQMAKRTKTIQYDIDIQNDGEYYFTVHQEAFRIYQLYKDIKYEYSYVRIFLAKNANKREHQYIDQKQQKDIEVQLESQLKIVSEFLRPKQVPRDAELRKKVMLQVARENINQQQITTGLFYQDIFIVRIIHKKPLSQRILQIIDKVLNSQSQKLEIIIQLNLTLGEDKIVLCSLDPTGVAFTPKNQLVQ